jgi:hypothetical protein
MNLDIWVSAQLKIAFRIVDMNSPVIISKFLTAIWSCVWIKLAPEKRYVGLIVIYVPTSLLKQTEFDNS